MAVKFGEREGNGTYQVIAVDEPSPFLKEPDINLKGDHDRNIPVVQPDQQSNRKFKAKQMPQAPVIIR